MSEVLDKAFASVKQRYPHLPDATVMRMAEESLGVTPGGAARFRPTMQKNQPRESERVREDEAAIRGLTLAGAAATPFLGAAGMALRPVMASGAPEYGGFLTGYANAGLKPLAAKILGGVTGTAGVGGVASIPAAFVTAAQNAEKTASEVPQFTRPAYEGDLAEYFGKPATPVGSLYATLFPEKETPGAATASGNVPKIASVTNPYLSMLEKRVAEIDAMKIPDQEKSDLAALYRARMAGNPIPTRGKLSDLSDEDKGSALLRMGLGMMGSKSPYFAQGLSEGGTVGLDAAEKSRDRAFDDLVKKHALTTQQIGTEVGLQGQDRTANNAIKMLPYTAGMDKQAKAGTLLHQMGDTFAKGAQTDAYIKAHEIDAAARRDNTAAMVALGKEKTSTARLAEQVDLIDKAEKLIANTGNPDDVRRGTLMLKLLKVGETPADAKLGFANDKVVDRLLETYGTNPKAITVIEDYAKGQYRRPGELDRALIAAGVKLK